ncbi:MAG TPA: PH domain-containing protein [Magnetospirillaceae bacterium]|jgi:hypothetical protein
MAKLSLPVIAEGKPVIEQDGLLEPGEKILWEGQPRRGLVFRASDIVVIPLSLIWCGFAIYWEYKAAKQPASMVPVLGILFVLIGLHFAVGRFFYDAFVRHGTRYALTNQRVLISLGGVFTRELQSLPLEGLMNIRLSETRNGAGTIKFGADPDPRIETKPGRTSYLIPVFEGIEDGRTVYHRIHAAQKALAAKAR